MHLTSKQRQIAQQIDRDVRISAQNPLSPEEEGEVIMNLIPKHMDEFMELLDAGMMEEACKEYHGFLVYTEMMERLAVASRNGLLDDILPLTPHK